MASLGQSCMIGWRKFQATGRNGKVTFRSACGGDLMLSSCGKTSEQTQNMVERLQLPGGPGALWDSPGVAGRFSFIWKKKKHIQAVLLCLLPLTVLTLTWLRVWKINRAAVFIFLVLVQNQSTLHSDFKLKYFPLKVSVNFNHLVQI